MFLLLACAHPPIADSACSPPALEWSEPVTTLSETLQANPSILTSLDPALPEGLVEAQSLGLGTATLQPGEERLLRSELLSSYSTPDRRSLSLFLHLSDPQIADAESPTRFVAADDRGTFESAARPQELYAIHALDALIRTANLLVTMDFALVTGDDADSNQANELRWFADTLDGSPVHPDAGEVGSQLDDDCNDPIAAFTPTGLAAPWYAVAGNHDVLVQGNFPPDSWKDAVVGDDAPAGTRDLSQPGGPLSFLTPPDPERRLMDRGDLAAVLLESPASPGPVGHGFSDENVRENSVHWVSDPAPGLRLIAVDANPNGIENAQLSALERDQFLIPALQKAEDDGRLVIVTSHYAAGDLSMEGGGTLADLLQEWPNVVLMAAGHYHENRIRAYGKADDPGAFWEILTDAVVDWPGQGRFVELVTNGDGSLSIFTTMFNYLAPEGSMAARARSLTLLDFQSGWRVSDGSGAIEDRNCELLQKLPPGWNPPTGQAVRSLSLP